MQLIDSNTLSVGMVKDTSPLSQKDGTYPYALNAIMEGVEGDFPFITNELGTRFSLTLPENSFIIGSVLTDTNTFIVFLAGTGSSYIVEYFPVTNTYSIILEDTLLNFRTAHPIKALFRIRKGCERTIYFTDNYNPYRVLEIDNLAQYGTPVDINNIKLQRDAIIPKLEIQGVQNFGGNHKVGSYSYAIQYLDSNLNETAFLDYTPTIPLVDDSLAGSYWDVDGGVPLIDSTSQEGAVPNCNKAVILDITNLDTNFKFFRIAVIASTSTTGEVSETYLLNPVPITNTSETVVVRDLSPTNATLTSLDTIQNTSFPIELVGSHAQIDNRLVLGNLSYTKYDWSAVQRAAQDIEISWATRVVPKNDVSYSIPKGPEYYFKHKSFLRDEVYALGIYGKLKTTEQKTPVFHIPGRVAISTDTDLLEVGVDINEEDVKHLGKVTGEFVETWQVLNTATNSSMAYWESEVDYPEDEDCDGNRIYPEGKIRHHKFPSVDLAPIEDTDNIFPIGVTADLTTFLAALPQDILDAVQEWVICRADRKESDKTILDRGYISTAVVVREDHPDEYWLDGDRINDFYFLDPVS